MASMLLGLLIMWHAAFGLRNCRLFKWKLLGWSLSRLHEFIHEWKQRWTARNCSFNSRATWVNPHRLPCLQPGKTAILTSVESLALHNNSEIYCGYWSWGQGCSTSGQDRQPCWKSSGPAQGDYCEVFELFFITLIFGSHLVLWCWMGELTLEPGQ